MRPPSTDMQSLVSKAETSSLPSTKATPKTRPKEISRSQTSEKSVATNRMPDCRLKMSISVISGGREDYVERLASNVAANEELQAEIARRQNLTVRAKANKYDQLDAKARLKPTLVEMQKGTISRQSTIFGRIQSFEMVAKEERTVIGPTTEERRRRRE